MSATRRAHQTRPRALSATKIRRFRATLLEWAAVNQRTFFWREPEPVPFRILVAEVLLGKTRAEVVEPVALALLDRYPRPVDLATARCSTVERLLRPLGLYRKRARSLIGCARAIIREHDGSVPSSLSELLRLPYVGRYAANAILSVAFDRSVAVLDANVSRIYQRVFSLPAPYVPLALAHDSWKVATRVLPKADAKRFNWAVLDLGGTICTARAPSCSRCPVIRLCDYSKVTRDRPTLRE